MIGYFYLKRERFGYPAKRKIAMWRNQLSEAAEKKEHARRVRIQREIDRILDKINRDGIGSLTDRERRFLKRQGGDKR